MTKADAQRVLGVGVAQHKAVEGSLCSLTKQRRDILPNPGRLENVIRDADEYLEMIPEAKNRAKNTITLSKSDFHTETPQDQRTELRHQQGVRSSHPSDPIMVVCAYRLHELDETPARSG